jgi:hypothetical protein
MVDGCWKMDGGVGGEWVTRVTAVGGVPVLPPRCCLPGCQVARPLSLRGNCQPASLPAYSTQKLARNFNHAFADSVLRITVCTLRDLTYMHTHMLIIHATCTKMDWTDLGRRSSELIEYHFLIYTIIL